MNIFEKYTPAWFSETAKAEQYRRLDAEAEELRNAFCENFGTDALRKLDGRELLTRLFYSDDDNRSNMCYMLEHHIRMKEVFGSIAGGSAYKFELFFYKKNRQWTTGSPQNSIVLSEEEAIRKAGEIRDHLVEGAEIINNYGECNTAQDYEELYDRLKHIPGIDLIWVRKYYQMLYPNLFAPFYAKGSQTRVLMSVEETPDDSPFVRMGQIALAVKKCGISNVVFGAIWFAVMKEIDSNQWFPSESDYHPGITTEQWLEMLNNPGIFKPEALKLMACFNDFNGEATRNEIAARFGGTSSSYNQIAVHLAQRVEQYTQCGTDWTESRCKWYPVVFQAKDVDYDKNQCKWRVRPELQEALTRFNISKFCPPISDGNETMGDKNVRGVHYWLYSPGEGASKWNLCLQEEIMVLGFGELGDLTAYDSKDDMRQAMKKLWNESNSYMNSSLATWQFVHKIMPGDVVFAKRGKSVIIGRGVVSGDYQFDADSADEYKNIRAVHWTHEGEWSHPGTAAIKPLTDITQFTEYVDKLNALFDSEEDEQSYEDEKEVHNDPYSAEKFLSEVFMSRHDYDNLVTVLRNKKNIILQGAPGVGKTFAAKRLAYSIIGEIDRNRVQLIQFHQSYSYEDFIEGYRPVDEGFAIRKGAFYKFCKKAADDDENDYFFIIDEINRGNLSKIFGELFMLIETDKRGHELQLLYSDEKFSVPKNVHLIGMMNTADRSLAMLDYALRRRFAFIDMKPGFDTEGFIAYQKNLGNDKFNELITRVKDLNTKIAEDATLGEGFCIGHSYFCGLTPEAIANGALTTIVEYELIPLLKEYWFDEAENVRTWSEKLRGAIK